MRICYIGILMGLLLIPGCEQKHNSAVARQNELNQILQTYLKPAVETEKYQNGYGWSQPASRQALAGFVAKNLGTEEAFQAEIWLSIGLPQQQRFPLADRLKIISETTTQSGTAKFAKFERADALYQENINDHAEFMDQAAEILNHFKEYRSDKQFLRYMNLMRNSARDVEPYLRLLVVNEEAYAGHLDKAIESAKNLKKEFPYWQQQSVNGAIEMLELHKAGWQPYASRN